MRIERERLDKAYEERNPKLVEAAFTQILSLLSKQEWIWQQIVAQENLEEKEMERLIWNFLRFQN